MLGIGVDCVLINRIESIVGKRLDPHSLAKRILSANEYKYFGSTFTDPRSSKCVSFLAGRFALKEASFKALSSSSALKWNFSFKDIETATQDGSCVPVTTYLPSNLPLVTSLTHDGGIAIAVALVTNRV
ncbi:hypothetical protein DI09_144p60 [Mitosporidium daphniae]|uniref:4'-phosphopantetheinyl transferase domain-containing protein n=1 Tax=Mitosporidium daphniae TaxID=1485682 RepID=A0A098VUN0_9MICR|nr:uncharacterized protein DI09_144p60 [Mitosporidium daphniae]KGG52682.1 hypothetical protein DI09_144p60 [Mitosporidium daphniae]|eukprot:XP_013239118.1 uncharacterized protein DI09_144p60 [Mitosporidium daphniae]